MATLNDVRKEAGLKPICLTPCERDGHNYKIVWHDEKSLAHRTLLVCAKCGETKIVYF